MKKLLLITFLFLITPDAKADMDYVCSTAYFSSAYDFIFENCERNNILLLEDVPERLLIQAIAYWCRQDRAINYLQRGDDFELSCVLYDKEPRIPATLK